jgi:hypothetical protein
MFTCRSPAKASITLTQFKESMKGIYSSTVNKSTIDELPMAYKPMNEIVDNIDDTADIVSGIKPLYNLHSRIIPLSLTRNAVIARVLRCTQNANLVKHSGNSGYNNFKAAE